MHEAVCVKKVKKEKVCPAGSVPTAWPQEPDARPGCCPQQRPGTEVSRYRLGSWQTQRPTRRGVKAERGCLAAASRGPGLWQRSRLARVKSTTPGCSVCCRPRDLHPDDTATPIAAPSSPQNLTRVARGTCSEDSGALGQWSALENERAGHQPHLFANTASS